MLTHEVSVDPEREIVVKRYRQFSRGEPAREWRALRLLAEHAPGLAPEPFRADLAADQPLIEMSLLPGEPLGGAPLTQQEESALVRALGQLWQSVPVERIIPVEGEEGNAAQLLHEVRQLVDQQPDLGDDALVQAAYAAGVDWLTWAAPVPGDPAGAPACIRSG